MTDWRTILHGLTYLAALERIAEERAGMLHLAEARQILISAGVAKGNPKNLGPSLYHILESANQFAWAAPGQFRLLTRRCDACGGTGRVEAVPSPAPDPGPKAAEEGA